MTAKRVSYPPLGKSPEASRQEVLDSVPPPSLDYVPLQVEPILQLYPTLSARRKHDLKQILNLIKPNILMLAADDMAAGRFLLLTKGGSTQRSFSHLLTLLQYFFGFRSALFTNDLALNGQVQRPPDAPEFLRLLKQSRVPARFLSTVIFSPS